MKWVLVLLVFSGDMQDYSSQAVVYADRRECEKAAKDLSKTRPLDYPLATALGCVPVTAGGKRI